MALSNSFDFTLQRDQIIKRSLLTIGAIGAGETPTSDEIDDASEYLNLIIKAWHADGMQLWRTSTFSVTPIQGQQTYTLGTGTYTPRPTDVLEVYRRDTTTVTDVELNRYARVDYFNLSDKDSEGVPVNWYYDPQQTAGKLYIWPTASSNFATNNTLEVRYTKPFDDMDSSTDNLAFPQEWELSIVLKLAVLLAREYGVPTAEIRELKQDAKEAKDEAMAWDTEHTSLYLTVDTTPASYS